jgi:hypothetical protein
MKRLTCLSLVVAALTLAPATARAGTIYSTGPVVSPAGSSFLNDFEYLAVEFVVLQESVLTGIEAWLFTTLSGSINVRLYSDDAEGGDIPGSLIDEEAVFVGIEPTAGWVGANTFSRTLQAGNYWAAFEPFDGYAGGAPFPAQTPALNYAVGCAFCSPVYTGNDALLFGVTISGSPTSVPEPASTATLLYMGLAGLAVLRSRRKK